MQERKNIFGMSLAELTAVTQELNWPDYRAKQLARWLYLRGVSSFRDMTDLSLKMREELTAKYLIARPKLKVRQEAKNGKTAKFLLEMTDGVSVESVLMRQPYGNSLCVSTQAGCNMGCAFCASTLPGLMRNLTAGEILAQVMYVNDMLSGEGQKVDTIVIMGSGEPLMNYDNVLAFIKLCHADYGLNMGYRHITLSTSGIVPNIYRLADENLPVGLSISLHAPTDELRSRLMPVNRRYPLSELVKAAAHYAATTGRRVTYEYILIAGINDTESEAKKLLGLLKGQGAIVNLIPFNPVAERDFKRSSPQNQRKFQDFLAAKGLNVTLRREMGGDIDAACGQLRNKFLGSTERK
ncbi:MAG: 23S rRNA (adenine(2503)-C(2))-methyltransferase RlmN [Selenomonadaceae bacterium]|nr:23S rRNA (adenine(2503)-C(2))-methyltransferase RlmN [Selenomonadaceae bacterium]